MKKTINLFLIYSFILMSLWGCQHASQNPVILSKEVIEEQSLHYWDYFVLGPQNFQSRKKYPLLLILTGRGQNAGRFIQLWQNEALNSDMITIAPDWQNPKEGLFRYEFLEQFVDEMIKEYPISRNEIYVVGVSAGALVASEVILRDPRVWKGAALMVYSPSSKWLEKAKKANYFPPLFFILGREDPQVDSGIATEKFQDLRLAGLTLDFYVDSAAGHEYKKEWNTRILSWIQEL